MTGKNWKVAIFNNVKAETCTIKEFKDWTKLTKGFTKVKVLKEKGGSLYSFAKFKSNRRLKVNVESLSAVIIDFDNQGDARYDPELIIPLLKGYNYLIHSTHRYTETKPRFRLIVPLDKPCQPSEYQFIYAGLLHKLAYPSGIDLSSREINRIYYLCSTPDEDVFFTHSVHDQAFISRKDLLQEGQENFKELSNRYQLGTATKTTNNGRNDYLKSIVTAMLFKGKSVFEILGELLDEDAKQVPPLFTDRSEAQYKKGTAEDNALQFILNIKKSVGNEHTLELASSNIEVIPEEEEPEEDIRKAYFAVPNNIINNVPNEYANEFIEHILSGSIRQQPVLALGATLALFSVIKGQNFKTATNLRGNLLIAHIAKSGQGKDHPQSAITHCLRKLGMSSLQGGVPASNTALFKIVAKAEHKRRIILWDEFGKELQALTRHNAGSYEVGIFPEIMRLYSESSRYLVYGKEYANSDGKRPTMQVNYPHLTVLGSTTPETFYSAVNYEMAKDGFLPRWLILQTESTYPTQIDEITPNELSPQFLDKMREWAMINTGTEDPFTELNLANVVRPVNAIEMPMTPKAKAMLKEMNQATTEELNSATNEAQEAILARKMQLVSKIALLLSDDITDVQHLEWAYTLVGTTVKGLTDAVQEQAKVADPVRKRRYDKVLNAIKSANGKGIEARVLQRQTHLKKVDFTEIITDLVEAKEIETKQYKKTPQARRSTTRYFYIH